MKITKDRLGYKAGTVVFPYKGHDYGCRRDDKMATGIEHKTLTIDPEGGVPFFTCPVTIIETE